MNALALAPVSRPDHRGMRWRAAHATMARALRLVAVVALTITVPLTHVGEHPALASASGSRTLALGDFADAQGAQDVSGQADGVVAGVRFGHAIDLNVHAASISLFTHKYPGYSRLSFMVGISDNATPGETGKLVVTADGKVVDVVVKAYGQAARRVTVSFDKASMITLAADPDGVQGVEDIIIGDPVLQR